MIPMFLRILLGATGSCGLKLASFSCFHQSIFSHSSTTSQDLLDGIRTLQKELQAALLKLSQKRV
jgi:hypothetical protein